MYVAAPVPVDTTLLVRRIDVKPDAATVTANLNATFCLFVVFFPQLIAGPIVHYREMQPQFEALKAGRPVDVKISGIAADAGMPHDFMLFPGIDEADRAMAGVYRFAKSALGSYGEKARRIERLALSFGALIFASAAVLALALKSEWSHGVLIAGLAAFFADKPARTNRVSDADLLPVGRYIYTRGNSWSGVPACITCHGEKAYGTANLPRLAGQHAAYTETQLRQFGTRERNNDNAVMHAIANDAPPALPDEVPPAVREVVAACLEKDPAGRFDAARDIALARAADGLHHQREEVPPVRPTPQQAHPGGVGRSDALA